MADGEPKRILFVCLGNICRSPTAEGVMRSLVERHGLAGRVEIDSAGTGGWHVGHGPDERSAEAAARRGITLESSARKFEPADFGRFDLICAMDRSNFEDMAALAPDGEAAERLRMFREFDPEVGDASGLDVPDPYYGGERGFEEVLDIVERTCEALLEELVAV